MFARLAAEKIPLLVISAVSGAVTIMAQVSGGALLPSLGPPLGLRAANAVISCVRYLGMSIWPTDLAAFYPFPLAGIPAWQVWGAGALLLLLSAACVAGRRRFPYVVVGWLWFLGMLVPVIGLVQVGSQALADRYTYLPHVGLFLALAWGSAAFARTGNSKKTLAAGFGVAISVLAVVAGRQVDVWRDNLTLFRHAVTVTRNNSYMHYNFGVALGEAGLLAEEIAEYREALRISPSEPEAHYNLALALTKSGRRDEAIATYYLALRDQPDDADAHNNLGYLLYRKGRTNEAIAHFRRALGMQSDHALARQNLQRALDGPRTPAGQPP